MFPGGGRSTSSNRAKRSTASSKCLLCKKVDYVILFSHSKKMMRAKY